MKSAATSANIITASHLKNRFMSVSRFIKMVARSTARAQASLHLAATPNLA
jgi:hypothetical protein